MRSEENVLFIVGDHGSGWLGFVHLHGHLEGQDFSWNEGLRSSHQVMAWMAKILHLEGWRKSLDEWPRFCHFDGHDLIMFLIIK